MTAQEPCADAWLRAALAPLLQDFPGIAPVLEWSAAMPYALSDLVGVELALDDERRATPASLHVRVPAAGVPLLRQDAVAGLWPAVERDLPVRIAAAVTAALGRDEAGFVVDVLPTGTVAPAALYAGVGADPTGRTAARALLLLGAPASVCAGIATSPALAGAISHVGLMPGRPGSPVRLVLADPDAAVWDELATMPRCPVAALDAARSFAADQTTGRRWYLNVDLLGDRLGPAVGVEVKQAADALVPGEALSSLRRWEGARYLAADGGPAGPEQLAHLLAGGEIDRESRWLGHLKLTFCHGSPPSLKAYLGIARRAVRSTH